MLYCDAVMLSHVVVLVCVVLCRLVLLRSAVMKLWCDVLEIDKIKRGICCFMFCCDAVMKLWWDVIYKFKR